MTPTILAKRTEVRTGSIDRTFEGRDAKGRTIGASAILLTVTYAIQPGNPTMGVRIQADTVNMPRYGFQTDAKRDGKSFGAYHRPQEFFTVIERDAAAAKYIAQAEKRAAKLAV